MDALSLTNNKASFMSLPDELLLPIVKETIKQDLGSKVMLNYSTPLISYDTELHEKSKQAFAVCPRYGEVYTDAYLEMVTFRCGIGLAGSKAKHSVQYDECFSACECDQQAEKGRPSEFMARVRHLDLNVVVHGEKTEPALVIEELGALLEGFKALRSIDLLFEADDVVLGSEEGKAIMEGIQGGLKRRGAILGRKLMVPDAVCLAFRDTTVWIEEDEL